MGATQPIESLFRSHFEQLPEPAYVWRRSRDGPYVLAQNLAAAEQAGEREVVGATASTLLAAYPELVETLEASMDDGEVRRFEGDMHDFRGQPCRIALTFVPVAEQTAVMHWRDVTEEHRSREALKASERQVSALIRSIPEILIRVTGEGKYVEFHAPPEALAFMPHAPEECVGRYVHELYDAEFAAQHEYYRRKAIAEGAIQFWQYARRTPDGLVHLEARFVRSGDDEVVITVRDVRQHVEREREVLLGVERERNRIGRDLHDGLAQLLTGATLLLEPIKAPLSRQRPDLGKNLRQAIDLIKDAIGHTRELARGLSPVPQGGGLSLGDALAQLAQQSQEFLGLACRCECDGSLPELSAETAANLYRIAQEALTNAAKHGNAMRVELTCRVVDGRLQLRIADDGRGIGMDEALSQGRGMGLNIMRYRARAIGAELAIGRGELGGTVVECTVEGKGKRRTRARGRPRGRPRPRQARS